MIPRAIIFRVECRPDRRDDYIARAQRHAAMVRDEAGCIRCDVVIPEEGGNVIYLYELFEDDAALKAHAEMPYMPGWREDIAPMVVSREPTFCHVRNG